MKKKRPVTLGKPLTRNDVLEAQKYTVNNAAAARHLGVSYKHYRMYARLYGIFNSHKGGSRKGMPGGNHGGINKKVLEQIIKGNLSHANFKLNVLKYKLVEYNFLKPKCNVCGFGERRITDNKLPLLLNYKNNNSNDWSISNLEFMCYNHFFLLVGDVFNDKDIQSIESRNKGLGGVSDKVNMDVTDSYNKKRLKEIGINLDEQYKPLTGDNIGEEFIARL